MMKFPLMALVQQKFNSDSIADVPAAVRAAMEQVGIANQIKPDKQIAITAGSRGITNIAAIIGAVADYIGTCGAHPFIFPAMGSHGGATSEGQQALLAQFNITESAMGCPIRSTMDVVQIGQTPDGLAVFLDEYASRADHLIVVNRVKPHTKFEGPIESGLMKMLAFGIGKHRGAALYHQAAVRLGMGRVIETVSKVVLNQTPILCGIGLVENGYDQTSIVGAATPDDLVEMEKALLKEARRRMARLPFEAIDLLIIDEIGKNISGTGMDTNVTGVNRDILGTFSSEPRTRRLFVRDLTPESEGNALGIGLADFTTARLVNKIDRKKTYINCLTGISPEKGAIPIYFDTDRECLEAALTTLGLPDAEQVRVVHIRNTLNLEQISVSKAYLAEIEHYDTLKIISSWEPLAFRSDGNLQSPFK
jgi:hypothetical protein